MNPITDPSRVADIIQNDKPELTDSTASQIGKQLAKEELTNSQIRNIFGTARQIEAKWYKQQDKSIRNPARRDLILLRSKLAYQAARGDVRRGANPVATLRNWIDEAIVATVAAASPEQEDANFKRLMEFLEAILAYHYDEDVRRKQAQQAQQDQNRRKG